MELKQVKTELAKELAELISRKGISPTIENIAELLLDSGIVPEKRARQFLAVSEFYRRYEGRKNHLVEELSVKYEVTPCLMWHLTNSRRYVI